MPPHRREELVTRLRLIEIIQSLLNKKLILISAPAGYGKTSLLIDMVDQSEIPICWLSLDVLDQDPQRFLAYFIACIQARFPSFGSESANMLMNTVSLPQEMERLVITLTNELYQTVHEHFAIILDDYQFIDSVPDIQAFVNRFLQLVGDHCHLILTSRILPNLPDLHLLVARDLVGGMSLEELSFSPAEIQTLFIQNASQSLSMEEAEEVAAKTDGWITSITLTGLMLEKGRIRQKTPAVKTGIELYDYFSREVLEQQALDLREFLLLTSLFDDVSLAICTTILTPLANNPQMDWRGLFHAVQSNNLFAIPVGDEGIYFRYQHLFQEYLQTKLREENPEMIMKVMTRLAAYYREQQDWEKAHHIYESINDQAALVSLIEETGSLYIRNGRILTLANWLERLPVSLVQGNPKLLSLQGAVAYTQGDAQMGISLLSQAEAAFRARSDIFNLANTLLRRASAYRELGDLSLALADAEETISLSGSNSDVEYGKMLAVAERVKAMTWFRMGRSVEAVPLLEDSLRRLSTLQDESQIPIVEMELGAIYYTLGNDETAIGYYGKALKAWEVEGNAGWRATLMNNLAVLHHYRGEYEKAFQLLEDAINSAQSCGYARAQALALSSLGDLLVDLRELDRSEECFDQARKLASQLGYSFLMFYTSVAKARIARLSSRFSVADTLLSDIFLYRQQNITPAEEALYRQEHGCLLLYENKPNEAVEEFTLAIKLYEDDGRVLEACILRLWLSAARVAGGEKRAEKLPFSEILTAYEDLNQPVQVHVVAGEVQQWLEKSKLSTRPFEPLQQIFLRADDFSQTISIIRKNIRQLSKSSFISPPHIFIHSFGPAQVLVNGKVINRSEWQTRETRDLFFFLLQSKPLTKEEIGAIFWPDISPSRLKMRFKTTLYRLRHAVGQDTILFEGERYYFNHQIDYEHDLSVYQGLIKKSQQVKNPAEALAHLQAAVELVKGSYLNDIDMEWADDERTHFETQFVAHLLRLSELALETKNVEKTLETARVVLKYNPLSEEAYRLMMRAQGVMKDTAGVVQMYQACCQVLDEELGIKPSKETEKVYRSLISSVL